MISIHDLAAVQELARRLPIDPHHLRRLRNAYFKQQFEAATALRELPDEQVDAFAAEVEFQSLRLQSRSDSAIDGASKLLFQTTRGSLIETVILRIASGRTTLCVSTQAGCAARCSFCATGKMGMAVDLSASEILDQVILANRLLRSEQRRVRNVVFMGMGEPFHNEGALHESLSVLVSPRAFALAPRRLLVSTVGIPEAMVRCAERFPDIGIALSLHSARQEVREQLIPLARRYPLADLRDAVVRVTEIQRRPVMMEYLLLRDMTDTADDLQSIVRLWTGVPVHLNLIPYNPIEGAPGLVGSDPARQTWFAGALRAAGFPVTVRRSLGADIAAACGQLARRATLA